MLNFSYFSFNLGVYFRIESINLFTEKLNKQIDNGWVLFIKVSADMIEVFSDGSNQFKNVQNHPRWLF